MYPGYSPADHEYGKAAEEYGKAVAEAKRRGVEIPKHPDIDYQIGQGKGVKRKSLAQLRELKQGSELKRGSSGSEGEGPARKHKVNGDSSSSHMKNEGSSSQTVGAEAEDENPVFVIDTKPTPVSIPHHLSSQSKRDREERDTAGLKPKKSKTKHSGDLLSADKNADETEDISAEVEARMKAKEEKRKLKEEKKRKRESEKSEVAATTEPANVATMEIEEKPKKKKNKVKHSEDGEGKSEQKVEKKRAGDEDEGEGEKKKKRRKKD